MVVQTCQCCCLNLSRPLLPLLCPHVHSLCLPLCSPFSVSASLFLAVGRLGWAGAWSAVFLLFKQSLSGYWRCWPLEKSRKFCMEGTVESVQEWRPREAAVSDKSTFSHLPTYSHCYQHLWAPPRPEPMGHTCMRGTQSPRPGMYHLGANERVGRVDCDQVNYHIPKCISKTRIPTRCSS